MTAQEYKELKDSILSELMTKIGEILEEKLKPLTEALKNFTPDVFNQQDDLQRDNFGIRKKTKVLPGRDELGCVKAKTKEILRDGFGCTRKGNLLRVSGYHY